MTAMLARRFQRCKQGAAVLLWAAGALAWTAPAAAQSAACPPARGGIKLNFSTTAPPAHYDHSLDLPGIAAETGARAGRGEVSSRPVGLTTVNTLYSLKGRMTVTTRGKSTCAYLTSVDVVFGWDRMNVFVPREYRKESCEYRAVVDHENQHVAFVSSALRQFAPTARARVEAVLARSRPVAGGGEASLDLALAPVQKELSALLAEFNELHSAGSARIDTPSNYAAVTALCKNWDGTAR